MIEGVRGRYGRLDCAFNNLPAIAGWHVRTAKEDLPSWSEEAFENDDQRQIGSRSKTINGRYGCAFSHARACPR